MTHTPGPWGYFIDDDEGPIHFPDTYVVDQLYGSHDWIGNRILKETDARLMAASPDLLNMLQRMVDECSYSHVTPEGVEIVSRPCPLTMQHAREAIAKATGKS